MRDCITVNVGAATLIAEPVRGRLAEVALFVEDGDGAPVGQRKLGVISADAVTVIEAAKGEFFADPADADVWLEAKVAELNNSMVQGDNNAAPIKVGSCTSSQWEDFWMESLGRLTSKTASSEGPEAHQAECPLNSKFLDHAGLLPSSYQDRAAQHL